MTEDKADYKTAADELEAVRADNARLQTENVQLIARVQILTATANVVQAAMTNLNVTLQTLQQAQ